jgi:DNA (cytosine-5)-methyltransferase 1
MDCRAKDGPIRNQLGVGVMIGSQEQPMALGGNNTQGAIDVATACNAHGGTGRSDFESETFVVAHSLRAEGSDASEDGTGRGTPLVVDAIAFSAKDSEVGSSEECAPTLRGMGHRDSHPNGGGQVAVAFTERTRSDGRNLETSEECAYALTNPGSGGRTHSRQLMQGMAVRRLTPTECERLQGMPDGHTAITYRGKPAADGPLYRAIGNSMAVPVIRWIGKRIHESEGG